MDLDLDLDLDVVLYHWWGMSSVFMMKAWRMLET